MASSNLPGQIGGLTQQGRFCRAEEPGAFICSTTACVGHGKHPSCPAVGTTDRCAPRLPGGLVNLHLAVTFPSSVGFAYIHFLSEEDLPRNVAGTKVVRQFKRLKNKNSKLAVCGGPHLPSQHWGRLRQEDDRFQASLGCMARPCLKNNKLALQPYQSLRTVPH